MAFFKQEKSALIAFSDGVCLYGTSQGIDGTQTGELVFNTSMAGYQEVFTDPSYAGQIICMTYPHIGNVGVNMDDEESPQCHAKGVIMKKQSPHFHNWRAQSSLKDFFVKQKMMAISDIDTRALTKKIRSVGAANICITTELSEKEAIDLAQKDGGISSKDHVLSVTAKKSYDFEEKKWQSKQEKIHAKVAVIDYGVKRNILRHLVTLGCQVKVFPAFFSKSELEAYNPDGIVLSNGPGDPMVQSHYCEGVNDLLSLQKPILAICLGYQLLALSMGAKIKKLSFGHHGSNHPIIDQSSKSVFITSQNHNYIVDETSLPKTLIPRYKSLFDQTLQGFESEDGLILAVQGHPEASPGPQETGFVFEYFCQQMQKNKDMKKSYAKAI